MIAEKEKTTLQKREAESVGSGERTRPGKVFMPAVDIFETDEELIVMADMPGADEKTIDVTLEQNVLTIQGRVEALVPRGFDLQYREYDSGDFWRSFKLGDAIDREKIDASYTNGVLKLRLPKVEPAKPKKIAVKTG